MTVRELTLKDFLEKMEDPRKEALIGIYKEYTELFHFAAGSSHNHQAWEGGYADHIAECLRANTVVYDALETIRPLPFTKDQAIICLFLHDIEKPFKYGTEKHHLDVAKYQEIAEELQKNYLKMEESWQKWEGAKWKIIIDLMKKFDFDLSAEEINALTYTHGEGSYHKKDERVSCELAAHVHHCDNISARIFHNDGQGLG